VVSDKTTNPLFKSLLNGVKTVQTFFNCFMPKNNAPKTQKTRQSFKINGITFLPLS